MAKDPITGLEIEEDVFSGPSPVTRDPEGKLSTGFTPLDVETDAGFSEKEQKTIDLLEGAVPEVIKATKDEAVVDRGTVTGEPAKLETTRDTFTDIQAKLNAGQTLTEEEKLLAGRVKALRDQGKSIESIFGEEERVDETLLSETQAKDLGSRLASGKDSALEALGLASIQFSNDARVTSVLKDQGFTDNQINQILRQRDAQLDIEGRKGITEERISEREKLLRESQTRAEEKTRASVERLQNQTQRLRSLRGVGRSTATEDEIIDLERQGNELIDANERKANLELQKIRLEEEGAEAETINSINNSIKQADILLQEKLNKNLENQAIIDEQLGSDFDTSINNMLNILDASGEDIGDFDEKATKALGYISDSKGNPLKLDKDGNPIAPKNELGQDVKISNFKDANDNTYVYKNGILSSIIQNDGTILTGDAVKTAKVPASVKADKNSKDRIDLEQKLRKEFNANPLIKTFGDVRSSLNKVKIGATADSAAGDIALVFNFMKMLDPGSVVREAEFATAQNAAGVPEIVRNQWNKLKSGEFLSPKQKQDFLDQAESIFKIETEAAAAVRDQFVRIGDDAGVTNDFIVGAFDDLANIQTDITIDIESDPDTILDSLTGKVTEKETTTEESGKITITKESSFEDKSSFLDFKVGEITSGTNIEIKNIGTGNVTQDFGATSPLGIDNVKLANGTVGTPGIDIDGVIGDIIPSTISGTVKEVITSDSGLGNRVVIVDEQGNEHFFNHMEGFNVEEGQTISKGDNIGTIGNSGSVIAGPGGDGSHLDYRVKSSKGWIDPNQFLMS